MSRVVVNVVELNRRRHVELESIALALAEAISAGESSAVSLDPVRELRRALSTLVSQPLPEALMVGTAEVQVELEAPAHELEALAEELERVQGILESSPASDAENLRAADELESLVGRLRHRALSRS